MAKSMIGKLTEFDPDSESFENFSERLENFFLVNSIDKDEDKKKAYFISIMGPKMYSVLKNLLVPRVPKDVSFKDMVTVLREHYVPQKNITYERFLFNKRNQRENESISEYGVQLKQLAASCKFEKFLDEALRDRFLCGLKSSHIQSKLLAEDSLTFSKALELALLVENAEKNVRSLHTDAFKPSGEINYVKNKRFGNSSQNKYSGAQSRPSVKNHNPKACYRCGNNHDCRNCPYKNYTCNCCKVKGHLAAVCRKNKTKPRLNFCDEDSDDGGHQNKGENTCNEGYTMSDLSLNTIAYANGENKSRPRQIVAQLSVNGVPIEMVVDTGAAVSVVPDTMYYEKFQHKFPQLEKCSISLKTYTGEKIHILGEFQADVSTSDGQKELLPLVVIQSVAPDQPILMGRNWLEKIKLDWTRMARTDTSINKIDGKTVPLTELVKEVENKYADVFDGKYGEIRNVEVNLVLKEKAMPVFCKPHNVPFALRPAVEAELEKLVANDIIYPVTQSEWATPIVVVPKENGSVRICGNYKLTVNPKLRTDHYPLPVPDEIFNKISGAKVFCKLDLANAYSQCRVSKDSQEMLTINTHKGLFRYRRLPYGVSSAGPVFQGLMENILLGLGNTFCYLDDILIIAKNVEEMKVRLDAVLNRLQNYGIKVNNAKSEFFKTSLVFLGHVLDGSGIHPSKELTKAIVEAGRPENVTQLRSYLGLLNYYGKFLPNLSTLLYPLHQLLNKGAKWAWEEKCELAFKESKALLTKNNVLMPFDPNLEIIVTADSSNYAVGAILAQILPDGTERPVAFGSRTLTKTEVKFAQVEKESLALVYAVKKFHNFLYGRKFKLVTDHRALTFLFGPTKGIPTLAAARIQRWALILAAYQYDLIYRKGSEIGNADALSRLPCTVSTEEGEISFFATDYKLPITYKEIGLATKYDPVLAKVLDMTQNGWPVNINDERLKPYSDKTLQLSVEKNCVLWGSRVIIPPVYRREILLLLHTEHPGESRMKTLARSYVWWPKIDYEIEQFVKECPICQKTSNSTPLAPLQPWSWCQNNWQRLHCDFAKFQDKNFLILVDSKSKWVEIFHMNITTSSKTIEKLRTCFAAYGLPNTLVTDGGPQFTSEEFGNFLKSNGVHHVLSPPYHPASNGLAERMVQTTKKAFLKQLLEESKTNSTRTLQHKIDNFLFAYRNTPHSFTGVTPAETFLKNKPRTPLSFLKPYLTGEMETKQNQIKASSDKNRGKCRMFEIGESVFVRTVRNEIVNWQPGVVKSRKSNVTYLVKVEGRIRYVHADHLRKNFTLEDDDEELVLPKGRIVQEEPLRPAVVRQESPKKSPTKSPVKSRTPPREKQVPATTITSKDQTLNSDRAQEPDVLESIRRSNRSRKAPDKLNL